MAKVSQATFCTLLLAKQQPDTQQSSSDKEQEQELPCVKYLGPYTELSASQRAFGESVAVKLGKRR